VTLELPVLVRVDLEVVKALRLEAQVPQDVMQSIKEEDKEEVKTGVKEEVIGAGGVLSLTKA
jgi:hypothetical protein